MGNPLIHDYFLLGLNFNVVPYFQLKRKTCVFFHSISDPFSNRARDYPSNAFPSQKIPPPPGNFPKKDYMRISGGLHSLQRFLRGFRGSFDPQRHSQWTFNYAEPNCYLKT